MKPLSKFTGILLAFLLLLANSHAKSYSTTLSPEAVGATGSGSAWFEYDSLAHTLAINITFFGLSGTTTIAHIHAATAMAFTGTAAPATQVPTFIGFPTGLQEGEFNLASYDLAAAASYNPNFITANGGTVAGAEAALIAAFNDGKAYLNIHTAPIELTAPNFGAGEIRGFIRPVPDRSVTGLLMVPALIALFGVAQRRRALRA